MDINMLQLHGDIGQKGSEFSKGFDKIATATHTYSIGAASFDVTALSVTGSGRLLWIKRQSSAVTWIRIKVDGVYMTYGNSADRASTLTAGQAIPINVVFKTSLEVMSSETYTGVGWILD